MTIFTVKENVELFNTSRFAHSKGTRQFAFDCVYNGLMEELEDEKKKTNKDYLINRSIEYLEEIGLKNVNMFRYEISELYDSLMNKKSY